MAYQFPDLIRQRFYSEWLVIDAEVQSPDGDWSFRCGGLLTFEATQLAHWLHRAASGAVPVTSPDEAGNVRPALDFTEPYIGFGVAGREPGRIELRIHFSGGGAPSWQPDERKCVSWKYFVVADIDVESLKAAAAEWDRELRDFPDRA